MTAGQSSIDPSSASDPGAEAAVRTSLAAHGLEPTEAEVAVLVAQYASRRKGVELLHRMPEARYESPAVVFTATPMFADWAVEP